MIHKIYFIVCELSIFTDQTLGHCQFTPYCTTFSILILLSCQVEATNHIFNISSLLSFSVLYLYYLIIKFSKKHGCPYIRI